MPALQKGRCGSKNFVFVVDERDAAFGKEDTDIPGQSSGHWIEEESSGAAAPDSTQAMFLETKRGA